MQEGSVLVFPVSRELKHWDGTFVFIKEIKTLKISQACLLMTGRMKLMIYLYLH